MVNFHHHNGRPASPFIRLDNGEKTVSSEFVDTDFIWMVAAPQFLIILTELIETMKEIWCESGNV